MASHTGRPATQQYSASVLAGHRPSNERAYLPEAEFKMIRIKERLSSEFKQLRTSWLMLLQRAPSSGRHLPSSMGV
jgi:hypothetical protein